MKNYILLTLLLVGCDQVATSEKDMQKYPDILPFILENRNFEAFHNTDLGWLHFSYEPMAGNALETTDSIADAEGWEILKESGLKRIYLKKIKSYPADNALDTLYVEIEPSKNRLYFKWH